MVCVGDDVCYYDYDHGAESTYGFSEYGFYGRHVTLYVGDPVVEFVYFAFDFTDTLIFGSPVVVAVVWHGYLLLPVSALPFVLRTWYAAMPTMRPTTNPLVFPFILDSRCDVEFEPRVSESPDTCDCESDDGNNSHGGAVDDATPDAECVLPLRRDLCLWVAAHRCLRTKAATNHGVMSRHVGLPSRVVIGVRVESGCVRLDVPLGRVDFARRNVIHENRDIA